MKKINFIVPSEYYSKILYSLIDPILPYLPEDSYQCTQQYDENCLNVSFFIENLPHSPNVVFYSHGLADKNWREGKHVKDYDYIFISGVSWREKLMEQGVDRYKLFTVGYTKLDPIFQGKITSDKSKYDPNKKIILYAPTHGALPLVSLQNRFDMYLPQLRELYTVIESTHPTISQSHNPTMQMFCDCDLVLSDCGSIIYEAWSIGKQIVFPDWLVADGIYRRFPNSFEDKIYKQQLGLHAGNMTDLINCIEYGLNNLLSEEVVAFIDGIFPQNLRGNSGKVTADKLIELANR
jgi:CDP-glycerol glycerophosphotransferase (TagB/SpsB family)